LEIAKQCCGGKIRRIRVITNKYNCGTFSAEVEVRTSKDLVKNNKKPYTERKDILKEDVMFRLCEGKYTDQEGGGLN
jgi:hypothetical protein